MLQVESGLRLERRCPAWRNSLDIMATSFDHLKSLRMMAKSPNLTGAKQVGSWLYNAARAW
jgi:hypothetical protein